MAVFKLKSGGGSSYLALIWAVALLLVGVYFFVTSLWPPSLLTLIWLAVALTGAFFVFRAIRQVQDVRSGDYPVGLELGADTFSVTYANGKTETVRYEEIRRGDAHMMDGVDSVVLQTDARRYDFSASQSEFAALCMDLEARLGSRFAVLGPRKRA